MDQSPEKSLDKNDRLMLNATKGDIEAFKRLYQRYAPLMKQFFIIRGVDRNSADDLVQKIFTCLWLQRKNYRPESSFETYLFSIVRHVMNKEIRQSRKIAGISSKKQPDSNKGTYKTLSQPEAEFYLLELTEALEAAKAKLTDKQFQALQASQATDFPLDKILKEFGCSKGVYKNRLKSARKRLRELLAPFFTGEGKRRKS
jgi:RNA polymerase sigma-70 factor (ECF subfamily)